MDIKNSDEINNVVKRRRSQTSNKLVLSSVVQKLGDKWLMQVNEYFNGMLSFKRNDLINVILENLDAKLTNDLLEKIKKDKLTDKQKVKWIYKQMMEADSKGLEVNFNDLIKTAQVTSKRKITTRKRKPEASIGTLKMNAESTKESFKSSNDSI